MKNILIVYSNLDQSKPIRLDKEQKAIDHVLEMQPTQVAATPHAHVVMNSRRVCISLLSCGRTRLT